MPDEPCIINGNICATYKKNPSKCALCINMAYYAANHVTPKKRYTGKNSKRMGATFERQNHEANQKLLASSNLTPNSGAGKIKGDEQITGIIQVMEELKTQVNLKTSRGSEIFTIRKDWLEKLHREASQENKEFWYLKFRFFEPEADTYVVADQDIIMSMIKTMTHDRREVQLAQHRIELAEARAEAEAAENVKLRAQLRLKEAEIKVLYDEMGQKNSSDCQESKS